MHGKQLMVIPCELRQKIFVENHDVHVVGHMGINQIVDLIKQVYWWRGLWGNIVAYVRSCRVCQRMKFDNQKRLVFCSLFLSLRQYGNIFVVHRGVVNGFYNDLANEAVD